MWVEHEAQYIRAIEDGIVDDAPPSRRQRHKVLAVDRDDDIAAVLTASRGKRRYSELRTNIFTMEGGAWHSHGSGGSGTDDPRTPDRSSIRPRSITTDSSGSTGRGRAAIRDVAIRVGTDIETLRWRERYRTVSPTGYAVVVWRGRRMPSVTAYDTAMRLVDDLEPVDSRSPFTRLPWQVQVRRALSSWRHKDEWFNYAPPRH